MKTLNKYEINQSIIFHKENYYWEISELQLKLLYKLKKELWN